MNSGLDPPVERPLRGRSKLQTLDLSPEPPLGRLDGVIDYLVFLVEKGLVTGESAQLALRAADLLRKAILREEPRWGEAVD